MHLRPHTIEDQGPVLPLTDKFRIAYETDNWKKFAYKWSLTDCQICYPELICNQVSK